MRATDNPEPPPVSGRLAPAIVPETMIGWRTPLELGASVGLDATIVVDVGKVVVVVDAPPSEIPPDGKDVVVVDAPPSEIPLDGKDVVVLAKFGVTELEAVEAGLLPISLRATTVKVYSVPLVSPVILQLSVEALCERHVNPPGELVAV